MVSPWIEILFMGDTRMRRDRISRQEVKLFAGDLGTRERFANTD